MKSVIEKKSDSLASLPARERNRLRRQAELHGVPAFALRLLTRKHVVQAGSDTAMRYRHD